MSKYDQTFKDLNRTQTPGAGKLIAGAVIGLAAFYALIVLTLSL